MDWFGLSLAQFRSPEGWRCWSVVGDWNWLTCAHVDVVWSVSATSMSIETRRRCALCQQRFGSGFQENVDSSEVLRARRMLIERNAAPDGGGGVTAIAPPLKQGIEAFLAELSQNRRHNGRSLSYQEPLDVCAFCTQFLPSTYRDPEADRKEEEERRIASAQLRAIRPSRPRPSHHASLIIQHRPSVPGGHPPGFQKRVANSKSPAPSQTSSQTPPSFRLLSSDAARVLRIDAPAFANSAAANVLDHSPPGDSPLLGAGSVLHDLGAQSRHESASILRDQQLAARSRHHMFNLRDSHQLGSSEAQEETRQARNIVLNNHRGAETLYTGASVVRNLLLGHSTSAADAAAIVSTLSAHQQHQQQTKALSMNRKERARVVPSKHGRHWKTELRFPPTARRPGVP